MLTSSITDTAEAGQRLVELEAAETVEAEKERKDHPDKTFGAALRRLGQRWVYDVNWDRLGSQVGPLLFRAKLHPNRGYPNRAN